jgi:hypothetical protein
MILLFGIGGRSGYAALQNRSPPVFPSGLASMPTAWACKVARYHASAYLRPAARILFSPAALAEGLWRIGTLGKAC